MRIVSTTCSRPGCERYPQVGDLCRAHGLGTLKRKQYGQSQSARLLRAISEKRYGGHLACFWCHRELDWKHRGRSHPLAPTIEHLIPRSRGGTNVLENLEVACASCNSSRDAWDASLQGG